MNDFDNFGGCLADEEYYKEQQFYKKQENKKKKPKLTDEQIVQALECCRDEMGCTKGCPCFDPKSKSSHCTAVGDNGLEKLALDLINRLKAENKRLKVENRKQKEEKKELRSQRDSEHIKFLTYEKKVEELSEVLSDTIEIRTAEVKTEAYKEFAKRLKIHLSKQPKWICSKGEHETVGFAYNDVFSEIDNLLKEMVSEG